MRSPKRSGLGGWGVVRMLFWRAYLPSAPRAVMIPALVWVGFLALSLAWSSDLRTGWHQVRAQMWLALIPLLWPLMDRWRSLLVAVLAAAVLQATFHTIAMLLVGIDLGTWGFVGQVGPEVEHHHAAGIAWFDRDPIPGRGRHASGRRPFPGPVERVRITRPGPEHAGGVPLGRSEPEVVDRVRADEQPSARQFPEGVTTDPSRRAGGRQALDAPRGQSFDATPPVVPAMRGEMPAVAPEELVAAITAERHDDLLAGGTGEQRRRDERGIREGFVGDRPEARGGRVDLVGGGADHVVPATDRHGDPRRLVGLVEGAGRGEGVARQVLEHLRREGRDDPGVDAAREEHPDRTVGAAAAMHALAKHVEQRSLVRVRPRSKRAVGVGLEVDRRRRPPAPAIEGSVLQRDADEATRRDLFDPGPDRHRPGDDAE